MFLCCVMQEFRNVGFNFLYDVEVFLIRFLFCDEFEIVFCVLHALS